MTTQDYTAAVYSLEAGLNSGCTIESADEDTVIVIIHHEHGLFFDEDYGGKLEADWVAISSIGSDIAPGVLGLGDRTLQFFRRHRVISMKQAINEQHGHIPALTQAVPDHWTGPYHLNLL